MTDIENSALFEKGIPFPINIMVKIFNQEELEKALDNITISGFLRMLNVSLTEKEMRVLIMRYRDSMTMQKVGDSLGVTRERIRRIEADAFRRLRNRDLIAQFLVVPKAEYVSEVKCRKALEKQITKLQGDTTEAMRKEENPLLSLPIENLNLSHRSYNVLKFYGCHTLKDFVNNFQTPDELASVRGLGRKSMQEILSKISSIGLRMPWEVAKREEELF